MVVNNETNIEPLNMNFGWNAAKEGQEREKLIDLLTKAHPIEQMNTFNQHTATFSRIPFFWDTRSNILYEIF